MRAVIVFSLISVVQAAACDSDTGAVPSPEADCGACVSIDSGARDANPKAAIDASQPTGLPEASVDADRIAEAGLALDASMAGDASGTGTLPACATVTGNSLDCTAISPSGCASSSCVQPPYQYDCTVDAPPPLTGCSRLVGGTFCCSARTCVRYSTGDTACSFLNAGKTAYSCPAGNSAGLPSGACVYEATYLAWCCP